MKSTVYLICCYRQLKHTNRVPHGIYCWSKFLTGLPWHETSVKLFNHSSICYSECGSYLTKSNQLFARYFKQANHIREFLPPKKAGIATKKAGKVCWRHNCYKIHSKLWDVKKGGDTDNIRHRTGKFLYPSRESLRLTYLGKAAAKSEEAQVGD